MLRRVIRPASLALCFLLVGVVASPARPESDNLDAAMARAADPAELALAWEQAWLHLPGSEAPDSQPPSNYRDWKNSDYTFYDTMAPTLHDLGIICEPDSREPWFMSAAHDDACLHETLEIFEMAVDRTIESLGQRASASK